MKTEILRTGFCHCRKNRYHRREQLLSNITEPHLHPSCCLSEVLPITALNSPTGKSIAINNNWTITLPLCTIHSIIHSLVLNLAFLSGFLKSINSLVIKRRLYISSYCKGHSTSVQAGMSYIFTMTSLIELTEHPLLCVEEKRTLQKAARNKPSSLLSEI